MTDGPSPDIGRLRVSYVLSQFPLPTQAFAVSDILALRELGHEVVVHTLKPGRTDEEDRARLAGVPDDLVVLRPRARNLLRWPVLLWRARKRLPAVLGKCITGLGSAPVAAIQAILCIPRALEIVDEVRKCEADAVHLFWSRQSALVTAFLSGRGQRPVLTAFVGAYDLVADDFLVEMAMRSADVVFSHSEANRAWLERRGRSRDDMRIIRRGIPLLPLDQDAPRDPGRWITASALVPEKNVRAVVEAFARARETRPGLRLLICGEGPDRTALEKRTQDLGCADAVKFMGHVERSQVFSLMQQAGIFLLLSTKASERLPNVVKEAMWCGCAIVSAPTEGIAELLRDEGLGRIVDPFDTVALDRAIASLMEEAPEEASIRRERARLLIEAEFSARTNMSRYAETWQGLAALRDGMAN